MAARSSTVPIAVILSLLGACGHGGGSNADAPLGNPDAVVDAMPDAAVDAMVDAAVDAMPVTPLVVTIDAGDGPITQWSSPATAVGQRAAVILVVRNAGAAAIDALSASITGPDAGDYAIVADGSTCGAAVLRPADPCLVRLTFAPAATGTRTAALHLVSGDATFDLPLVGDAVAATSGLVADAVSVDFGPIEIGQHTDATVHLGNTGAADLTLGTRTASGDFSIVTDACPATLAVGATCTMTVRFTAALSGRTAAALDVASSGNGAHVALDGLGLRRITVVLQGKGQGVVTSAPSGIDCGATCSALFFDDVTLTAVAAAPASSFSIWGDACFGSTDPTCQLPPGPADSVTVEARFDVISPAVEVTFAGTGDGVVWVADQGTIIATCTASCTTNVFSGASITLSAFTPSTFTGWTGACTGTDRVCDLGVVDDNRAITVTFDHDEREVASLLPRAIVTGLAMVPGGDVVVADATGVTRLSPSGVTVWTTPIAGGASDLATDDAGDVFGRDSAGLFALSPAGAPAWARTFATAGVANQSLESAVAASPDGTVIAVLTGDGAHVVDGSGADRFTVTGLTAEGVAVAPDGTVAIAIPSDVVAGGLSGVKRYSITGAALTPIDPLDGDYDVSIAYDRQGYLCASVTGFGGAVVQRFAPDLGNVFAHFESTGAPANLPAAVVADTAGEVAFLREGYNAGPGGPGLQLEVFSPTGTLTWTLTKAGNATAFGGTKPTRLAGGDHQFAVAGTDDGSLPGVGLPWILIYAMP